MLIEWWEAWLVIAITINTTINVLVFFGGRKIKKEQESQMKTTATRNIQKNVTKSSPTNNKNKRKAELSKPGKYEQKVMENSKPIYTGRGTL